MRLEMTCALHPHSETRMDIRPDFQKMCTAEQFQLEYQTIPHERMDRPGWYILEKQTVLVLPVDRPASQEFELSASFPNERFRFFIWGNDSDILTLFGSIAAAPVQLMARKSLGRFQSPNCSFRDPAAKGEESWRALFNGRITTPAFQSKGAADAYLSMLKQGTRKPEY